MFWITATHLQSGEPGQGHSLRILLSGSEIRRGIPTLVVHVQFSGSQPPPTGFSCVKQKGASSNSALHQERQHRQSRESANPGMLAVGAAHTGTTFAHHRALQQPRPTPDGRVKPDIVGADCGERRRRTPERNNCRFLRHQPGRAHVPAWRPSCASGSPTIPRPRLPAT